MAQIELPPKYYLTNFLYLLDFVQKKSMPLLQERELNFIRLFQTLSEDAQCLFIRLINRRKIFFKTKQLHYTEIANIAQALCELLEKQFISPLSIIHEDKVLFLLEIFTKNELIEIIRQTGEKPHKQAKKSALTLWVLEHLPFQQLIQIIAQKEEVIKQEFEAEVEFLLYLFFGNLEMDMTRFVVRDLGYVHYEQVSEEKYTSFFKSRKEAEDKLKMEKAYQHFGFLSALYSVQELYDWFISQMVDWQYLHESAQRLFDKLCLELGKLLEKNQLDQEALKVYQHTSKPPSMERQVRLLYKLGFEKEAMILCKKLETNPLNPEEKLFAIDFREKLEKQKGKTTRTTTQWLKQAESINIDSTFQGSVEVGVLTYFKRQGFEGLFTENYLWNALFGVLFWDIIFDENQDAIHHPFQLAPSDLMSKDFWEKRKEKLLARTAILEDKESFLAHIQVIITTKQGKANPFIFWHQDLLFHLNTLYELLDSDQIGVVLLEMAKNVKEYSKGFPDLFIWNNDTYYFIEVKSPNDQLAAHQVFWLSFFQEVGINAKVLRVAFD
jgi:hypothetical protein